MGRGDFGGAAGVAGGPGLERGDDRGDQGAADRNIGVEIDAYVGAGRVVAQLQGVKLAARFGGDHADRAGGVLGVAFDVVGDIDRGVGAGIGDDDDLEGYITG